MVSHALALCLAAIPCPQTKVDGLDGTIPVFCDTNAVIGADNAKSLTKIADTPFTDGLSAVPEGRYRIPAIAAASNGVVLAIWDCRYNGSGDLPNAIDLAESTSVDSGATWSRPRIGIDVENGGDIRKSRDIGDPCLLYDPRANRFWAMSITGGGIRASRIGGVSANDVVLYTRGGDRDARWEEWTGGPEGNRRSVKRMIINSLHATNRAIPVDENSIRAVFQGPGHGMVQRQEVKDGSGQTLMPAGTLVFPMQYLGPVTRGVRVQSVWRAFAAYSTDGGRTWRTTDLAPPEIGASQENCIVELDDGSWCMMAKFPGGGKRLFFRTNDFKRWVCDSLVQPSMKVQGSCLRVGRGEDNRSRYVCCFSTSAGRGDITLRFGRDATADGAGITWDCGSWNIYPRTTKGYSYNSLAMIGEDILGVLFESDGRIYFRRVRLDRYSKLPIIKAKIACTETTTCLR